MPKGYPGRPTCTVDGCDKPNDARGMCRLHYQRAAAGRDLYQGKPTRDQRFADCVTVAPSGCWEWTASLASGGYGVFWDGRQVLAHRWSYERHVAPIPEGMHLDHLCRNRRCVNPDHLEPVTVRENVLRGVGLSAANARKTHCKRGHEFTPANTYIGSKGDRSCRACKALNARERNAKPA